MTSSPRVGVIGGGSAGLCAARHLLAGGLRPQVWEATSGLGGTWRHSKKTGTDQHGLPVYSSMYDNLRTNLPKEVMVFQDFPFDPSEEEDTSFVHHTTIAKYLERYAHHYGLMPYIKTEHHVERVTPVPAETKDISDEEKKGPVATERWAITVRDLKRRVTTTDVYDAVLVCNGHYSTPYIPKLPGIEDYLGRQMHSHDYREPSPFTGKSVLVLGAGPSGVDIAIELCSVAKKVYLSHNKPKPFVSDMPKNMCQVKGATEAMGEAFILADGTQVTADAIVYCTGYEYSFPFLSGECGVSVREGKMVTPLYQQIHHALRPTMAFIGIPDHVCPFPFFDTQVRYVIKVLMGQISLPSPEDMLAATQKELRQHREEGRKPKDFHYMFWSQWEYMRRLEEVMGETPLPPVIEKLFTHAKDIRYTNFLTFRNRNYRVTGPDAYEVIQ